MKYIAVFDFDGTLTTKDTMIEFIKYSKGTFMLFIGLLLFSPLLILMKLRIYPNWKAKQQFFSFFFKGYPYEKFKMMGESFKLRIDSITKCSTMSKVKEHLAHSDTVYVISASAEEWIKPWCLAQGITNVLGTRIEVREGIVTGRFLSENCYGAEKVNRLSEMEPDRQSYYLYAYGDSRGDKEMLSYADEGIYVR